MKEAWKAYDKWLDTGKKHPEDDSSRYKAHIEPKFGDKPLSAITTHDLEEFKASLLRKRNRNPERQEKEAFPGDGQTRPRTNPPNLLQDDYLGVMEGRESHQGSQTAPPKQQQG